MKFTYQLFITLVVLYLALASWGVIELVHANQENRFTPWLSFGLGVLVTYGFLYLKNMHKKIEGS